MSNRLKRKHRKETARLQSFRDKLAYRLYKAIEKKILEGQRMREIKFRKTNEDGQIEFFSLNREQSGGAIEQYTGLIDKNGKEIYEGDIVNVIGIGIAQVIDSPTGEWMLYYRREPDEINHGFVSVVPKNKPNGLWKANTTSYIEVIGNIHENPELLGDEK